MSAAGGLDVLRRPLANGDVAVVLFNETGAAARISTSVGHGTYTMKDLWTGTTTATGGTVSAEVPAHGAAMFRVSKDR
ncbi:hypothetical protein [Dactylosporangium sp. CA-139066]|uniref:hypothetical protein n=1 Tax=Dactylosporangium sp. CA-139066 TaxID=3239930 RepID=UPI003D8F54A5